MSKVSIVKIEGVKCGKWEVSKNVEHFGGFMGFKGKYICTNFRDQNIIIAKIGARR
jgi:hypothetical protein